MVDFLAGQRVRAVRDLTNGPGGGPKEGNTGIAGARLGKSILVTWDDWNRNDGTDRHWFALEDDIEHFFKTGDRVCLIDEPHVKGTVTDVGDPGDSYPFEVEWDDGDPERDDSFDNQEIRMLVGDEAKLPPPRKKIPVGSRVVVIISEMPGDDRIVRGDEGVLIEDDDTNVPYNVRFDRTDEDGDEIVYWCKANQIEKTNVIKTDTKRLTVGDRVEAIEDIAGHIPKGKKGTIVEDDESNCPYNIEWDGVGLHWSYAYRVKKAEEAPASIGDILAKVVDRPMRGKLKVGDYVIARADLEFVVKKEMVGQVTVGEDEDGDVQIQWEDLDDEIPTTFVSLAEQDRLLAITKATFDKKKKMFKVGDRVEVTDRYDNAPVGLRGTVAKVGSFDNLTVKFDDWDKGHDGNVERGSKSYYHVSKNYLKKLPSVPIKKEPEPKQYKKGDIVEATTNITSGLTSGMTGEVQIDQEADHDILVSWFDFDQGHSGSSASHPKGPHDRSMWYVKSNMITEGFAPGQDSVHRKV